MANKATVECVDSMLRKIMKNNTPFSGKVFVCLGNFHQTCPVIRCGGQTEIISASIRSSYLWPHFRIYHLSLPIRQQTNPKFAAAINAISDGAGPTVEIPFIKQATSTEELIDFIFPPSILNDPIECSFRSILAPLNSQIDNYNHKVLQQVSGIEREYLSANKLKEADSVGLNVPEHNAIIDAAAQNSPPGFPPHQLFVKTNAIFHLLCNFSVDKGLVKIDASSYAIWVITSSLYNVSTNLALEKLFTYHKSRSKNNYITVTLYKDFNFQSLLPTPPLSTVVKV